MAQFDVFVLNYNGLHFLPECLDSLLRIEKGGHAVQINLVDNGSTDDSPSLVRERFPQVNFIALAENHGFSRGNNLGVMQRQEQLRQEGKTSDYLVFLNNDTVVEERWLIEAERALSSSPRIGIAGSKSRFFDRFVVLTLKTRQCFQPVVPGLQTRGVFLYLPLNGENIYCDAPRLKLPDAACRELHGSWFAEEARCYIPVKDMSKPVHIGLDLETQHPQCAEVEVEVFLNDEKEPYEKLLLEPGRPSHLALDLKPFQYVDVIQNAGSYVRPNLEAGDRGFMEIDRGQYDTAAQVDAICGVSLFISANLFAELGGFDENYFAYYEDTDLCLRARLKGYDCLYVPQSSLRHVHCGSSGEYSEYFNSQVAFSQLVFWSKFLPRPLWQKRLTRLYARAREEFAQFENDHLIEHKPHLRAVCRYFKRYHRFLVNRWFASQIKPWEKLFSLRDAQSDYAGEASSP